MLKSSNVGCSQGISPSYFYKMHFFVADYHVNALQNDVISSVIFINHICNLIEKNASLKTLIFYTIPAGIKVVTFRFVVFFYCLPPILVFLWLCLGKQHLANWDLSCTP